MTALDTTLGMAVRMSTPYLFAALGGMLAQRSGVYNFALEGMMLGGAYFGYLFTLLTKNLMMGILGAVAFGILTGWLLAFISIRFGVSQMMVGLGMNTLYMGITSSVSYTHLDVYKRQPWTWPCQTASGCRWDPYLWGSLPIPSTERRSKRAADKKRCLCGGIC